MLSEKMLSKMHVFACMTTTLIHQAIPISRPGHPLLQASTNPWKKKYSAIKFIIYRMELMVHRTLLVRRVVASVSSLVVTSVLAVESVHGSGVRTHFFGMHFPQRLVMLELDLLLFLQLLFV